MSGEEGRKEEFKSDLRDILTTQLYGTCLDPYSNKIT